MVHHVKIVKNVLRNSALVIGIVGILSACGNQEPLKQEESVIKKYPVTVTHIENKIISTFEATGTVKAERSTIVIPPTSGVVTELFVREGSRVTRGTPLFRIGGANSTAHPFEIQMKIAHAQATAAINAYNATIEANRLALEGAYIGYYSSVNQTQSGHLDQQVFAINLTQLTEKIHTLNDALTQLHNARNQTSDVTKIAELDTQITEMENTISQTQYQAQILELNQTGLGYKLGLTQTGSFPELQGWLQVPSTEVRNQANIDQAKTQVELSKQQYELAKSQWEGLLVRAETQGIIHEMNLAVGSFVSPQTPSASIINTNVLTAKIAISEADSYRINNTTRVEIAINNEFHPARIVDISPTVDQRSNTVFVTIQIPPDTIRVNGTAHVRFMLDAGTFNNSVFFLPLDAVIVSTEETFIFIIEDEKAKKRTVKRGNIIHDRVEILEGLTGNEQVILDGAKNIFDGQAVEIIPL